MAKEGYSPALIESLKKLNRDALSDLNPHPAVVKLEYSHPTLSQTIEAINEYPYNSVSPLPRRESSIIVNKLCKLTSGFIIDEKCLYYIKEELFIKYDIGVILS